MTDKECEDMCKKIKEYGDEVCKSKESARAFLVRMGFCNEDGTLTEAYR